MQRVQPTWSRHLPALRRKTVELDATQIARTTRSAQAMDGVASSNHALVPFRCSRPPKWLYRFCAFLLSSSSIPRRKARRAIELMLGRSSRETVASLLAATRSLRIRSSSSGSIRSEEHTSELQSRRDLVCRLLLEKKKKKQKYITFHTKKKNHKT